MSARARHRSKVAQRGFTALENLYLFDPAISAGALRLYAALKHYAWMHDGEIPSQAVIAGAIGTTDRSVRDDFKELERRGLVTIERRSGQSSIVHIETPEDSSGVGSEDSSGGPRPFLPGSGQPQLRARDEDSKTAVSKETAHSAMFEAIKAAIYPPGATLTKREAKQVAIAAGEIVGAGGTPLMVPIVLTRWTRDTSFGKCVVSAMGLAGNWSRFAPVTVAEACAECGVAGGRHAEGCGRIAA